MTAADISLQVREYHADEIAELQAENVGLRADIRGLAETLRAAVEMLGKLTEDRQRARHKEARALDSLNMLREALGFRLDDVEAPKRRPRRAPRPAGPVYAAKHRATAARDLVVQ
ncbi:MAG: hypothetical protein ABI603_01685 [Acidobacteriota bacterium]